MASGFFEELNPTLNIVNEILFTSQTLLKYLVHQGDDPINGATISDPESLLFNQIYPFFKIPEPEDKVKTFINVVFGKARPNANNNKYIDVPLLFDIVVHIESWKVRGGVRPYFIIPEIDKLFNNVQRSGITINKVNLLDLTPSPYGNRFYGHRLEYKLTMNSNIKCNG